MKWYNPTDCLPQNDETVIVARIGKDGAYAPDRVMTGVICDKASKKWWYDGRGISLVRDTDRWTYPPLPED